MFRTQPVHECLRYELVRMSRTSISQHRRWTSLDFVAWTTEFSSRLDHGSPRVRTTAFFRRKYLLLRIITPSMSFQVGLMCESPDIYSYSVNEGFHIFTGGTPELRSPKARGTVEP